jgi:hypothetical protein
LRPWATAEDISKTAFIRKFAGVVDPGNSMQLLESVLADLDRLGHTHGIIRNSQLSVVLVEPGHPYWRCTNCGRIHLHEGVGICTRCCEALKNNPAGVVDEIRHRNFLAKRVERARDIFRLHCEELTGQTDNPAERQRRFKNVLLKSDFDGEPASARTILREANVIDLLAVTTTMEVGVDIGPLQGVFQANMPPQRFNYQQRVGRAGRRGQAYSMVTTVCRSKSHDLHYFRHPAAITGDNPPPPFLNKRERTIPQRLILKAWFSQIFAELRSACEAAGLPYPGDDIRPPDIHGEFIPYRTYLADPAWRNAICEKLLSSVAVRDEVAACLLEDKDITLEEATGDLNPELLIERLDRLQETIGGEEKVGLAHSMAEAGLLPMFGMPTRVRPLYHGIRRDSADSSRFTWQTVDRELDVAIYEFAPGQVIVKDKWQHAAIGFTGSLPDFLKGSRHKPSKVEPRTDAFDARYWLLQCASCGAWSRHIDQPLSWVCKSCGVSVDVQNSQECRTPAGFRTDLRPTTIEADAPISRRHRTITAEAVDLQFDAIPKMNLAMHFQGQVRTSRINGGEQEKLPDGSLKGRGFSSVKGNEHRLYFTLSNQVVSDDLRPTDFIIEPGSHVENFWLASSKTTDALFIAPSRIGRGLQLNRVAGEERVTGVRAAAVSALSILVNCASLELDADPEEFDIIDPRIHRLKDGSTVPLLQITDHLINGSGYCRRLAEDSGHLPLIAQLMNSLTIDTGRYPLREFNRGNHRTGCDASCYLCLQRYGNQPYHGLLDWRLGLAFLHLLVDEDWRCGLDGNFDHPSLTDWPGLARRYVEELHDAIGIKQEIIREFGPITVFRLEENGPWVIVVHPLWDCKQPDGILDQTIRKLPNGRILFADTFDLARRPLMIRQRILMEARSANA